jgi:hypothetical protein
MVSKTTRNLLKGGPHFCTLSLRRSGFASDRKPGGKLLSFSGGINLFGDGITARKPWPERVDIWFS